MNENEDIEPFKRSYFNNRNLGPGYTHKYIYRNTIRYINLFDLAKVSDYFRRNFDKFAGCETINFNGNDGDPDVSDYIQTFFYMCHNNKNIKKQFTFSNAIPIHYLSSVFNVIFIKKKIERFIIDNYPLFIEPIIQYVKNAPLTLFMIKVIEKNLLYIIQNYENDILSLPINTLYHILKLYYQNQHKAEDNEQVNIFLFKCIDVKGRDSSILFSIVDLSKLQINYIIKLIEQYQTLIDFSYIEDKLSEISNGQKDEMEKIRNNHTTTLDEYTDFLIKSNNDIIIPSNILRFFRIKKIIIESSKLILKTACFERLERLELIDINCINIEIGTFCFQHCQLLTEFSLRTEQDLKINDSFFSGCISLKKLILVTNSKLIIQSKFMSNSQNLQNVTIGGSEIIIGDSCFTNCESLLGFTITGAKTIQNGKNLFDKSNKIETISIAYKDTSIVNLYTCFFNNSQNLVNFNIKGGDVTIDNNFFKTFTSLKHLRILETNSITVGKEQFKDMKSLIDVVFSSKSNINLNDSCFSGSSINEIALMSNQKIIIENNCFENCLSLNSFIVQKGLDLKLGNFVFHNCPLLSNIDFNIIRKISISNFGFNKCQSIISLSIYANEIVIGNNCFEECSNLEKVILNASLYLKVTDFCFANAKKINSVILSGSKIIIGKSCFFNFSLIPSINIENSDRVIFENNAFEGCNNLDSVNIKANIEFQAGINCFHKLEKLGIFNINGQKTIISSNCFAECSSLKSFCILNAIEVIFSNNAFESCENLERVDISAVDAFKANNMCFSKSSKLENVQINSKQIGFGSFCFEKCSSNLMINCMSAAKINLCETCFNDKNPEKHLKYPSNTQIKIIKAKQENNNDDQCLIF